MSHLPQVSGKRVASALHKIDYDLDRQKGSHIILRQIKPPHRRIVVTDHKEIAKDTLIAIIREAGLTVGEFKKLV